MSQLPDIVIEVRGGNVVEVYSQLEQVRIVIVDWDNFTKATPEKCINACKAATLTQMPAETILIVSGDGQPST